MATTERWVPAPRGDRSFRQVPETFSPWEMEYQPDDLLTTDQVAELLGVTTRRVQAMIAAVSLPATRYGRIWLIRAEHAYAQIGRKPGRPPKVMEHETYDQYDDWRDDKYDYSDD